MDYEQAQLDSPLQVSVYLEREYLWGPGDRGVDELLVQFDHTANRGAWWVIQDDGGDVVAVCDTIATGTNAGKGRVVQQLTYDAYGEALTMASLHPHPVLRCGHKGLFVDRLDIGVMSSNFVEFERIVPFGDTLCYNRNRTYSPMVGRFLQADPNATGMGLDTVQAMHAISLGSLSMFMDMERHYGDSSNHYHYLQSNPATNADPLGLELDPLEDLQDLMGLLDPIPGPSDFITGMYRALFEDYSENLTFDVDWAGNWGLPDDDHSRTDDSWIWLAFGRGLYEAFELNLPFTDDTINPLDVFGARKKKGAKGTRPGKVKNGHTVYTKRGQGVHKGYKQACAKRGIKEPEWRFEVTIPGIGRLDRINIDAKVIGELKPNSPAKRAEGVRQVTRYLYALEKKYGGRWTGYVDVYDVAP
jgi:hypothetical protein